MKESEREKAHEDKKNMMRIFFIKYKHLKAMKNNKCKVVNMKFLLL